jgi:hypothetical protein
MKEVQFSSPVRLIEVRKWAGIGVVRNVKTTLLSIAVSS